MLFAIKRHFVPSLALAVIFIALALVLRWLLDLQWNLRADYAVAVYVGIGTALLVCSDGGLHGLLLLLFRRHYATRYRALVEYFRSQGWKEILAGGVLAGAEELVFRGVVQETLQSTIALPPVAAIAITGVVFGVCHIIPSRQLWPFALWAVWEGTLLSVVYYWSGSLLASILLHGLHDIAGFCVFAAQRRWVN